LFDPSLLGTFGWLSFDVPTSELIADYCDRSKDRIIEQFETKPNITNYLCALIESLQEMEFVFGDLLTLRRLDNARGAQLDGLGDIVGAERSGLTDDAYRIKIRFQIGLNFSNGEVETLITLVRFITDATEVHFLSFFPGTVSIETNGPAISAGIVATIEESAPAGVKVEIISTFEVETAFQYAGDIGDPANPETEGYAEPNFAPDAGKGGQYLEKFI